MDKSTVTAAHRKASQKPSKPRADFPLFPHASGRWAKKIRQQFVYFGKVADDPLGVAALEIWLRDRDELLAGRKPRGARQGLTIKVLVNEFLNAKRHLLDTRELSARMFADWHDAGEAIINEFGKDRFVDDLLPTDFDGLRRKLEKRYGPHRLGSTVGRVRGVFRFALENRMIDRPTHFGTGFTKPSKKTMRLHRAKGGLKMFEAEELRKIIDAAGVPLRAMILLGANCGFGNSDIANLPLKAVDLATGWVNFPRPKTGINRRCPLWKETIEAIQAAIDGRPTPKKPDADGLLFVTCRGAKWGGSSIVETEVESDDESSDPDGAKEKKPKLKADDPISKEFAKLLRTMELQRAGVGFYGLRHGFETIAGGSRDQVAVDSIMGHARDDMAGVYRERIEDSRLVAVVDHVRAWLPKAGAKANKASKKSADKVS